MYTGFLHTHSFLAIIVLILLAVITLYTAFNVGKVVDDRLRKLALATLIASHTQVLIGAIMYFMSPYYKEFLNSPKEVMANATARLYVVEHPLTMIVVVVLVTVAYSQIKKLVGNHGKLRGKHFAMYLLALILALLMVPWKAWLG